ncbi:LysR family transcriptional regulator [Lactiplantibacillus sp. WILCCON 0030]|uniref:LysR family transcriptional regulator n=1 Tax=Lactiplantibacillus brownii TaxID=3069269 RepID=A0ABU1A9Y8_9LACO|nr:LysR family transcriptional regulator [Lactiplantibacillus brownii]MDQ7937693.1 LysR family transcriptional regulator [Lactiplantibacillus brownii]
MDINQLQTFLRVSEYGSFTKAGEQSFISGTAVMKQINRLETELNLKLFVRTTAGVKLTPQGQKFQPYVRQILDLLNTAVEETRQVRSDDKRIIKLGTSLLHPADPFMSLWKRIAPKMPKFQIRLAQLQEDLNSSNREYAMLGRSSDVIVGTFDNATLKQSFSAIKLGTYRFGIAVRSDNPLAQLDEIAFNDLAHQKILMVPKGISEKNDQLRHQMLAVTPSIQPIDTKGRYDINTFNETVEENIAMVSLTPWRNIHPNLVTVPLKTTIEVPYGLLSPKLPGKKTADFLHEFTKLIRENEFYQ